MRDDHLDRIHKYRKEGRHIYYYDELWTFKKMTFTRVWKDIVGESIAGRFTVSSGRGARSILSHIR